MSTITKRRLLPIASAAALLLIVAAASAGATAVTFTTPKAGSTISLRSNPYTAVAGSVSFAPATAQTSRFYLRRDGCGTSNDDPHLSTTSGTDGGDGCGLIVNAVVGLGGDADQSAFIDFPSTDGMPLALDASRSVTGAIDITGTSVGLVQVDVSMEALVNGQGVVIGSDSESALVDPTAADNPIAFTIHPDATLAGSDLQGLDLRVHIHGPNADSGFVGLSGKSWTEVPSYAASVNRSVQISVDDQSFAQPIPARLDATGSSWSVAIATPPAGKHTLYAKSTQGFDTSAPASTTFTVKR
jgi:hypothetical protein